MAFEFVTQAPRSQQVMLGVLALVLLGAGGYFLVLSPKTAELEALRGQHAAKQSEIVQSRAIGASLARFKAEAQAVRARLEAAKERLPADREIPRLYRLISDMALEAGLSVSLFQPKELATKDIYQEIPIAIGGESGFHQLGTFFDRLSRLSRIVNLTDLKLLGVTRAAGTLRAELTLATYVFRPEGAPPPPPSPGMKQ